MEQAEERETSDVSRTGFVPFCGIGSAQTRYWRLEKTLKGKQKNTLCKKIMPFLSKDTGIATTPTATIPKEIDHKRINTLTVQCDRNLVTYRMWHTLIAAFYYISD